ncbi:MAG: GAF domain-containing sensor histidine kinase [Thermoleophilia bacterium]
MAAAPPEATHAREMGDAAGRAAAAAAGVEGLRAGVVFVCDEGAPLVAAVAPVDTELAVPDAISGDHDRVLTDDWALVRLDGREAPRVWVGGPRDADVPWDAASAAHLALVAELARAEMRAADAEAALHHSDALADRLVETGIALASQRSLDDVLRQLVDTARDVLTARYAALGVLNPARTELERFITSGLEQEKVAALGEPPRGHGLLGALITSPQAIVLSDLNADPRSCGLPPGHPPMRGFLGVPVMLRGEAFGNLYVTDRTDGRDFTEDDIRLARTLAAQAAVAVDNARRYEAERLRVGELRSVQEVAHAIMSTLDLDALLPLIVRRARQLTGADSVGIALFDAHVMHFRFADGRDAGTLARLEAPVEPTEAARFLRERLEAQSVIVEPMEVDGSRVGALAAVVRAPVDDQARRLLSTLASQASIAVANAETFAAERRRLRVSAQVQAAEARASAAAEGLRQAIRAQEAERARVARELHDEAGQSLTALALNMRTLDPHVDAEGKQRLAELRQMVNGINGDLRTLATDLRPSGLRDHGLASAIERQAARLSENTGIQVDVLANGLPDDLPEEVAIALFRVVQEAFTNIARHSGARRASVVASCHGGHIRVVVEDDGRGFDPKAPTGGLGLAGIRERVELIGGSLRLESAGAAGTTLIVNLEDPR